MKSRTFLAGVVFALPVLLLLSPGHAGESVKLAAPIYPGSMPAVPTDGMPVDPQLVLVFDGGSTLDCQGKATLGGDTHARWCFLSKDPVDKVRAFYEKAVGTMRPVQGDNGVHGYQVVAERAWFDSTGEDFESGHYYTGLSLHALAPPHVKGQTPAPSAMGDESWPGQEDYAFYADTRFFGGFLDAVDFFGDPTKRPAADLDALYAKKNYLESAIFQRRGSGLEAVDATLTQKYGELRAQRQASAQTDMMTALMQQGMSASRSSAGPTAAEDAQFNAVMASDPALQQRYTALTQQVAVLMQQGKFDEADAVLEEIDDLEASHPELAAMNNQQQVRAANEQVKSQAAEDAIVSRGGNQLDQAIWGTGLEMLTELDKEAYYTLIVIDAAFAGTEKDYSRDRGLIEAETAAWIPHSRVDLFGFNYPEGGTATGSEVAPAEPEKKEGLGSKLKKGFGILRDIGAER